VLDTARRLAELERQRAQDATYIRTLEQARGTLQREAASVGRERARVEERVRAFEGLLGEALERVGVLEGAWRGRGGGERSRRAGLRRLLWAVPVPVLVAVGAQVEVPSADAETYAVVEQDDRL
jgi:hypothetical protein